MHTVHGRVFQRLKQPVANINKPCQNTGRNIIITAFGVFLWQTVTSYISTVKSHQNFSPVIGEESTSEEEDTEFVTPKASKRPQKVLTLVCFFTTCK